jgi:uncharacterized damage-inducible protein DinB
MRKNLLEMT